MRIFSSTTPLLLLLTSLLSSINNNLTITSVIVGGLGGVVGVGVVDALSIQPSALSEYQFKLSSSFPLLRRRYSVFSVDNCDGTVNISKSCSGSGSRADYVSIDLYR